MPPHDDLDSHPDRRVDTLEAVLSRPPSWRRRFLFSGVALVAAAILVVSLWRGIVPAVRHALGVVTPIPLTPTPTLATAGTISATIPLGAVHQHTFVAASDTAVWVYDAPTGTVTRIDPATNSVVARITVAKNSGGSIVIGQQAVWITNADTGIVSRIDPQRNQIAASIKLTPGAVLLGTSPGAIWVLNFPKDTVTRIDEQTSRVVVTLSSPTLPAGLPIGITYGAGSVWICNRENHGGAAGVIRIDPQTNQIQAQIDVSENRALWCNGDLKVTAQGVWVPIFDTISPLRQHLLQRIDPTTNKVADLISLEGDMNTSIAADDHGVWLCDPTFGLYRVDPKTRQVVAKLAILGGDSMALGGGSLWLTRTSDNSVVRITPVP